MADAPPNKPELIGIELEVPEGKLRAAMALPPKPLRLAELALSTMGISEKLTDVAVKREARQGRAVTCQKGCGACCRQIVPLSPPEAWLIADVANGLPPARRAEALAVFARAGEALSTSGLREQLQQRIETAEQMMGLAVAYFALGVPCPFLRDESCSIYPYRPSICREYLVTSPPENCGTIDRALIKLGEGPTAPARASVQPVARIPVHVRLSEALARLTGKLLDREPEVIPLTMALEWAAAHQDEGRRTWDARMLIEGLVAELSPGAS